MSVGERDEHSGHMTTGHEWNGIKELNSPVPLAVSLSLAITFAIAVLMWVLLPSWPLLNTYTPGLLGATDEKRLEESRVVIQERRSVWMSQLEEAEISSILANPELSEQAKIAGKSLFADNCSVCHGTDGTGGPGFPNLADNAWLWGGDGDAIMETLRVGINSTHDDSRYSEMPAFGVGELLDRQSVLSVISYVQSINSDPELALASGIEGEAGAVVFEENCASCHGDDATGSVELGAPNLTDPNWIYGSDRQSLFTTVWAGRQGHMPHWDERLSVTQRKILTVYLNEIAVLK